MDPVNSQILGMAADRFKMGAEQTVFIGGHQNIVYEYRQDDHAFILRLTPSVNRTENLIKGELDWILYLAEQGVSVSKPINSRNGFLTEVIEAPQGVYTCVCFEKAQGQKINYPDCLRDNELYQKLGQITGKLHALSKEYQPKFSVNRRHDWSQNWFLRNIDLVPPTQIRIKESYINLVNELNALPIEIDSYGLIHGDIGVGNFMVDERGNITLFDFDEAQYSWFVEDIAIQLYYLVYVYGGDDGRVHREEQASRFMEHSMNGYVMEHALDEYWVKQIPLFLRLRELIVYIGSFRNWDGDETFSSSDNLWFKDWIKESRMRIEEEVPIVDIWRC